MASINESCHFKNPVFPSWKQFFDLLRDIEEVFRPEVKVSKRLVDPESLC